jgi:hypothetical protein
MPENRMPTAIAAMHGQRLEEGIDRQRVPAAAATGCNVK